MDIVIHGTKGGRKIFTTKKLSGLLDVTADSAKSTTIGQEAYAIRHVNNSIIFSKYKIIRDVRGDKRTGFVAFSLFMSNDKELLGSDIISLLDRVSEEYCQRYIIDNNLNEVNEAWGFLDRISSEYKSKIRTVSFDDIEKLDSGSKDDAFIYYKNNGELKSYFDEPFQDEFGGYRQVLFVSEELKGKPENSLNALRHSDDNLTGIVDLENIKYKLLFNSPAKGGVTINVKVNGEIRSNKNKIRREDELEITWENSYYKNEIQRGKLYEFSSEFIIVDDIERTVSINEIELREEEKNINLEIKHRKEGAVYDAEIYIKSNYQSERRIYGNRITLKGNELGQRWEVWANKGDNMFTDKRPIDIEKDCSSAIKLILKERKIVKIVAIDEGSENTIDDFKVWVQGDGIKRISEIVFEDDDLDKTWRICIEKSDDYDKSDVKTYCPAKGENTIYFNLKKSKKYLKKEHKKKSAKGEDSSDSEGKNKKDKPFYKNIKVIAALIVSVLILILSIAVFFKFLDEPETQSVNRQEIENYVKGNDLFFNKLDYYKENWEHQKPEVAQKSDGILGLLFFWEKEPDTIEYNKWKKVNQSIIDALEKRNLINKINFKKLKNLNYFNDQINLKSVIEEIDTIDYEGVKVRLGDVSVLKLTTITDSIHQILNQNKKLKEESNNQKVEEKESPPVSAKKSEGKEKVHVKNPTQTKEINTINIKLKGGSIKIDELNNYKKKSPTNKSIQLYLDFWGKVKDSDQKEDFDELQKKAQKNTILKDSALEYFLQKICKDSDSFLIFKEIPGRKVKFKTLDQLNKALDQLIKK